MTVSNEQPRRVAKGICNLVALAAFCACSSAMAETQLKFAFRVNTAIEPIAPGFTAGFGLPVKYAGTAEIVRIDSDPTKRLKMHAMGADVGFVEFPSQLVQPDGTLTREPIPMLVVGTPNVFGGRVMPNNSATISFGDIDKDGVEDTIQTHGSGLARMVTGMSELPAIVHYFGICTVDGGTGIFAGAKGDIFLEGDMIDPDGMGPQPASVNGLDKAYLVIP